MKEDEILPFKIGQAVESRSFQIGYRGAWFSCEIKQVTQRGVALQYYDYPDDKLTWMRVTYQKPPWKYKEKERVPMLRPKFPPVYCDGDIPDINTLSEVILVRDSAWKVGDLVDWYCQGAYWSGKITEIKDEDEDKVQVDLFPRPEGEGLSYVALCKDLRPSLNWSLESGWTVPVSQDGENRRSCCRLIQPVTHAAERVPTNQRKFVFEEGSAKAPESAKGVSVEGRAKAPESAKGVSVEGRAKAPAKGASDEGRPKAPAKGASEEGRPTNAPLSTKGASDGGRPKAPLSTVGASEEGRLKAPLSTKGACDEGRPTKAPLSTKGACDEGRPTKAPLSTKGAFEEGRPTKAPLSTKGASDGGRPTKTPLSTKGASEEGRPTKAPLSTKGASEEGRPTKAPLSTKGASDEGSPKASLSTKGVSDEGRWKAPESTSVVAEKGKRKAPESTKGVAEKGRKAPESTKGVTTSTGEEPVSENGPVKRLRLSEEILLNSATNVSLESIIMDLEELVNRIRWTRKILESTDETPGAAAAAAEYKWKFQEHRAVATKR